MILNKTDDIVKLGGKNMKRVFLVVLDSVGIGELPDAKDYNDEGSHTLYAVSKSKNFNMPNMKRLGLFDINGVKEKFSKLDSAEVFEGSVARLDEKSKGKDTTTGHWEIAGIISETPFPTYPNGFPKEIISEFEERTGRKVICNLPYSGTEVILNYGKEHIETGALIVYTSADSVFQIAAHEDVVSVKELYRYCEIAREILQGEHGVGRVIARPFNGIYPELSRTSNRHDYSLVPSKTMLDQLVDADLDVLGVGKIYDIFAGQGVTDTVRTKNNEEGIERLIERMAKDFTGLCFVNLVDFDMIYGHRNNLDGYAKALSDFDIQLPRIISALKDEDILIITADHGCDPSTPSTDHSREYVPMVAYGQQIKKNNNIGTRESFADIAATILEYFEVKQKVSGTSFLKDILEG
jgi:phosphopentomutase